jgi:cell division protein FtsL
MRTVNLILIAAALAMAFALYKVKYDALASVRQIAKLEAEIKHERESVNLLKAEWSHLTQPGRLETLARKHLQLDLMTADQIVRMTELPNTPAPQDPYRDRPTIGDFLRDLALSGGDQ